MSSSLPRMRSAHMGTYAKDERSFERRSRVVRHRLRSNRRFGRSTAFVRMAVQISAVASYRFTEGARTVQTQGARSNDTCRAEDAHRAGMAENGTTSSSQSVDSRQSGRPHDQGHDLGETDQVRTRFELARITPRRLLADLISSNISYIDHRNSYKLQYHRLTAHGKLGTATVTGIDYSPQPFASDLNESAECSVCDDEIATADVKLAAAGCRTCSVLTMARTCGNLRYVWRDQCGPRSVSECEHRGIQPDPGHRELR